MYGNITINPVIQLRDNNKIKMSLVNWIELSTQGIF
jgi:hypothetical protein